ncbi:MAG: hypothetical protein IJ359_00330 [Erysipelotrichaceae bacterium]|nr:hypothetical protein [Erysipelotrichaceae bacterium]
MNEFIHAFMLKSTYRTNAILYYIKQIPFLKDILPSNLYASNKIKSFAKILAFIYEVLTLFIWKLLYLLMIIVLPMLLSESLDIDLSMFFHILFFFTFCGAVLNTSLLDASTDRYYAIMIMKMNAKCLALSEFMYFQGKQLLGLFISMYYLSKWFDFSWLACICVPVFVVSCKLIGCALFVKLDAMLKEKVMVSLKVAICGISLALILICPVFDVFVTESVFYVATIIVVLLAIPCLWYIFTYPKYDQLYRKLLRVENVVFDETSFVEEEKQNYHNKITDVSITSNKTGYAYLNDLFIKRHKKLLTRTTNWITLLIVVIEVALGIVIIMDEPTRNAFNQNVIGVLPYFMFVMYLINRGDSITKAMFINCDKAMLHYSFFRKGKTILEMFSLRLKSLVAINIRPAIVLAIGLSLLYALSGGTSQILEYVVIIVTILCLSVFYSVHYLVMYYLLQPFNEQLEMKSPMYQAVMGMTYLVAYMFTIEISSIYFGVIVIGITIVYCIVSLLLVYYFAPKTFRLK